jgi:hypothetical protein
MKVDLKLTYGQIEALVRMLTCWGYLGPEDCIDFDEADFDTKFCKALGEALPELVLLSDPPI